MAALKIHRQNIVVAGRASENGRPHDC